MMMFDLPCLDRCKSFYGKAKVIVNENGEKVLQSYCTHIAKITPAGEVVRLWSGNSKTSCRHFDSFLKFYGLPVVRFASLPVLEG